MTDAIFSQSKAYIQECRRNAMLNCPSTMRHTGIHIRTLQFLCGLLDCENGTLDNHHTHTTPKYQCNFILFFLTFRFSHCFWFCAFFCLSCFSCFFLLLSFVFARSRSLWFEMISSLSLPCAYQMILPFFLSLALSKNGTMVKLRLKPQHCGEYILFSSFLSVLCVCICRSKLQRLFVNFFFVKKKVNMF